MLNQKNRSCILFVVLLSQALIVSATEYCQITSALDASTISAGDRKTEQQLCDIDFENSKFIKLCPKTWSTSPSTIILGLGEQPQFANGLCDKKKSMKPYDKLAKFKVSMNESGTSGTFSMASLLYYQFSRYLTTSVNVPVAVYKSMNKNSHYNLVSVKAKSFENEMVRKAWSTLSVQKVLM